MPRPDAQSPEAHCRAPREPTSGIQRPERSQPERTGQEDRRLKFYELRDNLPPLEDPSH
jgi:hypothetical protein